MAAMRSSSIRCLAKRLAQSANRISSYPVQTTPQVIPSPQESMLSRGIFSGPQPAGQVLFGAASLKRGSIFQISAGNANGGVQSAYPGPSVEEGEAGKMIGEGGAVHSETWSGGENDSRDSVVFNLGLGKTASDQTNSGHDNNSSTMKEAGGKAMENASQSVKDMGQNVKDTAKDISDRGGKAMSDAFQKMKDMMRSGDGENNDSKNVSDTVHEIAQGHTADDVANSASDRMKGVADKAKDLSAGAGEKLKDAAGNVSDSAGKMVEDGKERVSDTKESVSDTTDSAAAWMSKTAQNLKDGTEDTMKEMQQGVKQAWDKVKETTGWASEKVEEQKEAAVDTGKSMKKDAKKVADKAADKKLRRGECCEGAVM